MPPSLVKPLLKALQGLGLTTPTAPLIPPGAAGREKDAILCKMEPTLSRALPCASSGSLTTAALAPGGLARVPAPVPTTWTTWGPESICSCGVWAGDRGMGERLTPGTGMEPLGEEVVGEDSCGNGDSGWWRLSGEVSELLSKLLREAEGLVEYWGVLPVLRGGGFGGFGPPASDLAVFMSRFSRSRGNLFRRFFGGSLALPGGGLCMPVALWWWLRFWLLELE